MRVPVADRMRGNANKLIQWRWPDDDTLCDECNDKNRIIFFHWMKLTMEVSIERDQNGYKHFLVSENFGQQLYGAIHKALLL